MLELDNRNVKALYRRAQAYIQLVDLDLAEVDIKRALEIDPDNRYFSTANSWLYLCLVLWFILAIVTTSYLSSFECGNV